MAVRGFPQWFSPETAGRARRLLHPAEDQDVQSRARYDPRALLDGLRPTVVFDEIQNVPELFPYIRSRTD